jgi:hypothetical protein
MPLPKASDFSPNDSYAFRRGRAKAGKAGFSRPVAKAGCDRKRGLRVSSKIWDALFAKGPFMHINIIMLQPLVALLFGILILILPRLLNYLIAIYLILIGLTGLFPHLFTSTTTL